MRERRSPEAAPPSLDVEAVFVPSESVDQPRFKPAAFNTNGTNPICLCLLAIPCCIFIYLMIGLFLAIFFIFVFPFI
jgi:hypothetical protein